MSPEEITEECVLGDLYDRTVAELPEGCRRAYVMVRERAGSYKSVAKALGVSPSAVSRHVVKAQQRLRDGFLASGIVAPPARRGSAGRNGSQRRAHQSSLRTRKHQACQ